MLREGEDPAVARGIKALPDNAQLIIRDMGMFLDDAIDAPDIAANFNSMPAQLLRRIDGELSALGAQPPGPHS
ncbi:MAG: hypothetical protein U1D55_15505 [Phycisphaerae bacterium]